jgi:hypothetical protein
MSWAIIPANHAASSFPAAADRKSKWWLDGIEGIFRGANCKEFEGLKSTKLVDWPVTILV